MATSTNSLARAAHNLIVPTPAGTPTSNPTSKQQAAPSESEAPCSSLLTSSSPRICSGIRKNGERCQARATVANDFCSFHRPDMLEAFRAGRIQGGRQSKYPVKPFEEKIGAQLALRLDSRGGIQASVDHVLRMLLFGGITPNYALAATRLIATASRNLDHTSHDTEDHSLDQYLPSISNHLRIQSGMKSEKQVPAGPTPQQLAAAASVPSMFEALKR